MDPDWDPDSLWEPTLGLGLKLSLEDKQGLNPGPDLESDSDMELDLLELESVLEALSLDFDLFEWADLLP